MKLYYKILYFFLKIFKCVPFFFSDLLPHNLSGQAQTREFLLKVVDILVDYINDVNDRDEKVLHFKHPEEMLRLLKLDIPNEGVPLQNLIDDCSLTLNHQVKTGNKICFTFIAFFKNPFQYLNEVTQLYWL